MEEPTTFMCIERELKRRITFFQHIPKENAMFSNSESEPPPPLRSIVDQLPHLAQLYPQFGVKSKNFPNFFFVGRTEEMDVESDCATSIDNQDSGYSISVKELSTYLIDSLLIKIDQYDVKAQVQVSRDVVCKEWKNIKSLMLWNLDYVQYNKIKVLKNRIQRLFNNRLNLKPSAVIERHFRSKPAFEISFETQQKTYECYSRIILNIDEVRNVVGKGCIISRLVINLINSPGSSWFAVMLRYIPKKVSRENLIDRLKENDLKFTWLQELIQCKNYKYALIGTSSVSQAYDICEHFNRSKLQHSSAHPTKANLHPKALFPLHEHPKSKAVGSTPLRQRFFRKTQIYTPL